MSTDLELSDDEEYFTADEFEPFEVPGRRHYGTEETSTSGSSVDLLDGRDDIRLLLVGKTGHGKSATANSLLGLQKGHVDRFLDKLSSISVTTRVERKKGVRFGRRIEIVDCPGFCDTLLTDEQLRDEILKAIAYTLPGFTAIGFVLNPERFTADLVKAVELFFQYFGNNVERFAFIILTHMDDEESAAEYLSEGHETLKNLLSLCKGGKTVLIDNKSSDAVKEQQVEHIIDELGKIEQKNGNNHFTSEMFETVTRIALECTPATDVENTDAALDDQHIPDRLDTFKKMIEKDKSGIFSAFLKNIFYSNVHFENAFRAFLRDFKKHGICNIM